MAAEKPSTDDDVDVNTDFASEEQPEANSSEDALALERDRVLRLTAELQNLRNRQARELADLRKYAPIDLMRDILPVLDNMDRALDAASKTGEGESLLEGIRLVRGQLASALAQHGCVEIAAEGEAFDPDRHQAILQQPSLEVPAGEVMMVTQAGYQLHDRVVRAAQVIVSAGPTGADGSA
jgi:molecular chaperone GrpE